MFEWDERMRTDNLAQTGVDFVRAAKVFDNPVIEREDNRQFAGEKRWIALGHVGDDFLVVVTTVRLERRRIIAAWRADHDDEQIYRAAFPAAAGQHGGPDRSRRALPAQPRARVLGPGRAPLSLPQPPTRPASSGS
jgi:uncharacterized DUF497 family protein